MTVTERPLVALESGDRLRRTEFHRLYCARPDIKRAELIEGVVYVASPVGRLHAREHGTAVGWLFAYAARTPGVQLLDNGTVYLSGTTEVQPDACLFRESPPEGTGIRETDDGFVEGAPDLVMEIAASSASYDLHDKKGAYQRAGVPEYIVWLILEGRLLWFRLRGGRYVEVEPDASGVIESAVFPGLRLDVPKLLAGDLAGVLAALG